MGGSIRGTTWRALTTDKALLAGMLARRQSSTHLFAVFFAPSSRPLLLMCLPCHVSAENGLRVKRCVCVWAEGGPCLPLQTMLSCSVASTLGAEASGGKCMTVHIMYSDAEQFAEPCQNMGSAQAAHIVSRCTCIDVV